MKKGGLGGANTKTGLQFEGETDLASFISTQNGYRVDEERVFFNDKLVARVFKKYGFYKFLSEHGIDWENHI